MSGDGNVNGELIMEQGEDLDAIKELQRKAQTWGDRLEIYGGTDRYPCPIDYTDCNETYTSVELVIHLNDDHECDWLSIADMLEEMGADLPLKVEE